MPDRTANVAVAAAALPSAPAPSAPAAAPASAPANAVQRSDSHAKLLEGRTPGAFSADGPTIPDAAPVVKVYGRQYSTDFSEGAREDAGRDLPTQSEIDAAMPPADAEDAKAADKPTKPEGMTARTSTPTEEKPTDPAATEPPTTEPAKPSLLSREERRKLLADLDAESTRRTNEQTVHAEKSRLASIEARLKGPMGDRLALAFPELGTPDQARDKLIEMLVSGQVAPAVEAAAAKPAEDDRVARLEREIEALKGTAPTNPDNVAGARLRMVAATMEQNGAPLPFAKREGDAAYAMGVKVAKAMYSMQGNKGNIDGARVMQVVEEHFEAQFVQKYGQEAADFLKGKPPTPAAVQAAAVAASPPAQRRPGGKGAHAATGVDTLSLDPAKRHRAIMAEIDASESTYRAGPR